MKALGMGLGSQELAREHMSTVEQHDYRLRGAQEKTYKSLFFLSTIE